MLMPALLPDDLIDYVHCDSEEALFNTLARKPSDLVRFFDYACDDESWSQKYTDFMRRTLVWVTMQSFQDKLPMEYLEAAAKSIRAHYDNLHARLPNNLIFKLEDTSIQVNSAMYAAASLFFHDLIRRECFDKKNFKLEFPGVSYAKVFRYVEEYVNTGYVSTLWKMELPEVMAILHYSTSVQMPGLSELCEDVLGKYLTKKNVCSMLLMAQKESLNKLKQFCFDFINGEYSDVYLESRGPDSIACKFLEFSEKAMDLFEQIRQGITHLVFTDSVSCESGFGVVVKQCPRLVALDLSHSNSWTEYFSSVPSQVEELNLSACEWLSTHYLKKVIEVCPGLHKLYLASNVQLNANSWGELIRLGGLNTLDLTRCQQVRDDDFRIILHACGAMTELSLEDCKLLSERAFFDLARACTRLQKLNLSRTHASDTAVIEIASRCRGLTSLTLTRCDNITDRGVLEVVKHALSLQTLDVTSCHVTKATIQEAQAMRPTLSIISGQSMLVTGV